VRVVDAVPRGVAGWDVTVQAGGRQLQVHVPLVGRHNVDNAACALAVAVALDLDLEAAARGIAGARPGKQRGELAEIAGRRVLVDCYNANPASMRAALATLAGLAAGHTAVAVLGDMLELGDTEDQEHQAIGRELAALGIRRLITLGERAREIARAAQAAGVPHVQVVHVDDIQGAARLAASWTAPGDWILVKASRGMRLERVVEALREVT
jgi:UDP-N-acetylmuramyl pentapeptide synthase